VRTETRKVWDYFLSSEKVWNLSLENVKNLKGGTLSSAFSGRMLTSR